MKTKALLAALGICLLAACTTTENKFRVDEALDYCNRQVERTLNRLHDANGAVDYTMMPRNILNGQSDWNCRKAAKEEWCAGFWPGVLWYDYEYSGDKRIKEEAEKFTASLEFLSKTPAFDHDLGFLIFCSYGNGYRLTQNPAYKQVILDTADTLATLFKPQVGTMLSWPRNVELFGGHNTIMDNMINLEMLFWAAKNGGNPYLADIAISHADKTMKYHFRPDYTSYHVAVYDTLTGDFVKGVTHQGYADSSMWARGQAWAIYGYTVCYRETKNRIYLDQAIKTFEFMKNLKNMPEDLIPYWDMDAPDVPAAPRDASSASVIASALYEMSTYDLPDAASYRAYADKIMESLASESYTAKLGENGRFILMHSVGSIPHNSEVDVPLNYADYYYLEALKRKTDIEKTAI